MDGEYLAVCRHFAMHMSNFLATRLQYEIPSVRINFRRMNAVDTICIGDRLILALPVLHLERDFLAVRARDLLLERVDAIRLGVDACPGLRRWARCELRLRNIQCPRPHDRIRCEC